MSLEKANITWTAKQLGVMVKNGKINFDHIVQRSYVWERSRKSALIESMIIGYPVPPIFAKRMDNGTGKRGDNTYYIMDGKQRLSTVKEYLNDEFALTEISPITYHDDIEDMDKTENISEKKFSELPEGVQDIIKDTTFSITYFDNLTKEEERELFKRLNAGKPLSAKSRTLASCKDIEGLLDIGSHQLFEDMLSEKAIANKNQVSLVAKFWCMMFMDFNEISFESKTFNPLLENLNINANEKAILSTIFDYVCDIHSELIERENKKVARKIYTETHLVSLMPFFKKAVEDNINVELMVDWIESFFTSANCTSISEDYNEYAGSGVAKAVNIQGRYKALESSFNEFFAEDNNKELLA